MAFRFPTHRSWTGKRIPDEEGLQVRFHLNNLIQAKKAAGRHKDLDDLEKLTSGS
jgi:hypothetical protein